MQIERVQKETQQFLIERLLAIERCLMRIEHGLIEPVCGCGECILVQELNNEKRILIDKIKKN